VLALGPARGAPICLFYLDNTDLLIYIIYLSVYIYRSILFILIYLSIYLSIDLYIYTDLNSLPSLLTLSKPHSPRTHAVAPHELRCDSPAHSDENAVAADICIAMAQRWGVYPDAIYIYSYIDLSICLSIYLFIYLYLYLSIYLHCIDRLVYWSIVYIYLPILYIYIFTAGGMERRESADTFVEKRIYLAKKYRYIDLSI